MLFDQFLQRNAHLFLNSTRLVNVPRDIEELGTCIVWTAKGGEPICTTAQDIRHNGNTFNVVHCGWAAPSADVCWEWRLHTRLTFFAFKALDHRGFFTTDVSTHATVNIEIELKARATCIVANKLVLVGFIDSAL